MLIQLQHSWLMDAFIAPPPAPVERPRCVLCVASVGHLAPGSHMGHLQRSLISAISGLARVHSLPAHLGDTVSQVSCIIFSTSFYAYIIKKKTAIRNKPVGTKDRKFQDTCTYFTSSYTEVGRTGNNPLHHPPGVKSSRHNFFLFFHLLLVCFRDLGVIRPEMGAMLSPYLYRYPNKSIFLSPSYSLVFSCCGQNISRL